MRSTKIKQSGVRVFFLIKPVIGRMAESNENQRQKPGRIEGRGGGGGILDWILVCSIRSVMAIIQRLFISR